MTIISEFNSFNFSDNLNPLMPGISISTIAISYDLLLLSTKSPECLISIKKLILYFFSKITMSSLTCFVILGLSSHINKFIIHNPLQYIYYTLLKGICHDITFVVLICIVLYHLLIIKSYHHTILYYQLYFVVYH